MDDFLKIRFALDNVHPPELGKNARKAFDRLLDGKRRPAIPPMESSTRRPPIPTRRVGPCSPPRRHCFSDCRCPAPTRARAALHLAVVNAGNLVWPVDELRASSSGRWRHCQQWGR